MLAEPAFSNGISWPLPGFDGLPPEPEDPVPTVARDTLLVAPRLPPTEWQAGSAKLDRAAGEPMQATKPAIPTRLSAWKAAILASCLLHVAAALAFLTRADDGVEIAGADQAGVMMLGNAADDQSAAGDGIEATNVTLVTMLDPKPAATVSAEPVTDMDTVRPVQEPALPVEAIVKTPLAGSAPERPAEVDEPVLQPSLADAAESVPAPADPTPDLLTVQAEQSAPVAAEAAPSVVDVAESFPTPPREPIPEIKPTEPARPKKSVEEKPAEKPARQATKKVRKKIAASGNSAGKPAKADTSRKKAGSGGRNAADSRRGVADGQADGQKEAAGKGGMASAAGNAATSNYPGKVAAKLRRAVRGITRLAGKARNDVVVAFTVDAGGGLGGVRIARSSGSPDLDQAALAVVRRAAPFPPIPPESGRRNWAFTLPLGIR